MGIIFDVISWPCLVFNLDLLYVYFGVRRYKLHVKLCAIGITTIATFLGYAIRRDLRTFLLLRLNLLFIISDEKCASICTYVMEKFVYHRYYDHCDFSWICYQT